MNQDQMFAQCWPGEQAAISATTTINDRVQLRVGGVVLTLTESQTTRLIDCLRGPLAEIRRRALHKSALPTDTADEVAGIIRTLAAVRSGGGALEMALYDQARGRHAGQPTPEWIERALADHPHGRHRRG